MVDIESLTSRFSNVGLNAEWAASAWAIDGNPRSGVYTGERFVVDEEDGTYALVARRTNGESDEFVTLARITTTQELETILARVSRRVTLTIEIDELLFAEIEAAKPKRQSVETHAARWLRLAVASSRFV